MSSSIAFRLHGQRRLPTTIQLFRAQSRSLRTRFTCASRCASRPPAHVSLPACRRALTGWDFHPLAENNQFQQGVALYPNVSGLSWHTHAFVSASVSITTKAGCPSLHSFDSSCTISSNLSSCRDLCLPPPIRGELQCAFCNINC